MEKELVEALKGIWKTLVKSRRKTKRPLVPIEALRVRAKDRENEIQGFLAHQKDRTEQEAAMNPRRRSQRNAGRAQAERRHRTGGHQHRWRETTLIAKWADLEWRRRWQEKAKNRTETTWKTPWGKPTVPLYEDLTKAEATALFLLRTEVIGLNAWLASINVPEILPRCECGWTRQTVHHILFQCPQYQRADFIAQCASERLHEVLSNTRSAQAAAKWLIQSGALAQFWAIKAMDVEDISGYRPFQSLEDW